MDELYDENFTFNYEDHAHLCEKAEVRLFSGVFLPLVYALCLLVGLAGNALVVFVYAWSRRLRSVADVLVTHLAAADLMLLLTLPFRALRVWRLGRGVCKMVSACYTVNFTVCMLLLACVSLDRYLALGGVGGGAVSRTFSRRHCWKICTAVWAAAFILGVPDLVLSDVIRDAIQDVGACRPVYPAAQQVEALLETAEVLLGFLLPLLVMIFCYWKVGRALRGTTSGDERRRAVRVLVTVVGVFVVTQLPYNILKCFSALDSVYALVTRCETSKDLDRAWQVTESLALTHCCLNPVLYSLMSAPFRQHLTRAAKAVGRWRRRRTETRGDDEMSTDSQETNAFSL